LLISNKRKLINNINYLIHVKKIILKFGVKKIDYIEIININKTEKPYREKKKFRIFIAYYLGKTRLIDNI